MQQRYMKLLCYFFLWLLKIIFIDAFTDCNIHYSFFTVFWFTVVGCMVDTTMHISGQPYLISGNAYRKILTTFNTFNTNCYLNKLLFYIFVFAIDLLTLKMFTQALFVKWLWKFNEESQHFWRLAFDKKIWGSMWWLDLWSGSKTLWV